jgi:hypothetical protein
MKGESMMSTIEQINEQIKRKVSGSEHHRIRPRDLEKALSHETGLPVSEIKSRLRDLIQKGELVFTYRDPCSFVEFPA